MRNKRNNKMIIAIKILVAVVILAVVFSTGTVIGKVTSETQTLQTTVTAEPQVKSRLVATHTVQYIDRPVTEVKYVEQVKRVPIKLRNFSDLKELKQWLEDKENVTTVRFQSSNVTVDCDDYALEMQRKALADGYIMSFEIIGRSEYNALFKTELPPSQSLHAINLAIIGNDAYYIEPQTSEVVFTAHLD